MLHFTATAVEHNRFAIVFPLLAANLAEERGKAVVVVHRPAIERVIVALRALSLDPHEDLGHVLGRLERVAFNLIEIRRRIR